jgi:enterochelin esterase-like enzyme
MVDALLSLDILDGLFPIAAFVLGAAALVVLLVRPPTRPWLRALAIAIVAGGAVAVLLWLVCVRWLNLFGGSLGIATYLWTAATCIAVAVAVASFHRAHWWRRIVAAAAVVVFLVCGVLGINATFGLNRTVGNLLNVVVPHPVRLAPPSADGDSQGAGALWSHWRPPAGMPQTGEEGTVQIPPTASGFHARSAGIYLPPAARTSDPPPLPVMVMLMGQPGNPDPGPIGQVLDAFAQHNHGLAPIVIVADQVGPGGDDTGCLDSARFGKVFTYLTEDVPAFIRSRLNVRTDHRFWTIAGYSNGGQCAISIGSKRPDLFRTIIDISGEEFPGSTNPKQSLKDLFANDQAAYDRAKPLAILSGKQLRTTTAVFTACVDDPLDLGAARKLSEAAKSAGMNVTMHALPSGGHTVRALLGGLNAAFADVYPVLDLSRPGEPARGG